MFSFALIGNCQIQTIEYLLRHMVEVREIWTLDFSDKAVRDATVRAAFAAYLDKADFIFIQPDDLSSVEDRTIKEVFPDKTFTIANLFFRGLHPDSCYVGSSEDRFDAPTAYHSLVVLDAFKTGKSEKEALKAFNIDNFERLGLMNAWDSSLEELRRRDAVLDLPAAPLVEKHCLERLGFWTINHPTIDLVYLYMTALFDKMGIKHAPLNLATALDPLAVFDSTPLFDFVAEQALLPYRTTQRWRVRLLGQRFIDAEEYVRRFYAEYRKADAARLKIHSPLDLKQQLAHKPKFRHLI